LGNRRPDRGRSKIAPRFIGYRFLKKLMFARHQGFGFRLDLRLQEGEFAPRNGANLFQAKRGRLRPLDGFKYAVTQGIDDVISVSLHNPRVPPDREKRRQGFGRGIVHSAPSAMGVIASL
jgi:hypothetical protein